MDAMLQPGQYRELACRRCDACRTNYVRSWAIRSHHETQLHTRPCADTPNAVTLNSIFITLTYADEHLPKNQSLDHTDFQKFMKRLRLEVPEKLRYLQCGEYGDEGTKRPHYHLILWGHDFHQDRYLIHQQGTSIKWRSPHLEKLWPLGFSEFSPCNFATAAYVAGYVTKKLRAAEWNDELRKQPYITMSRGRDSGGGLGGEYFNRHWHEIYSADEIRIGPHIYRPPAYYDHLLKLRDPLAWEEILAKRNEHLDQQEPSSEYDRHARQAIFASKNPKPPRKAL